MLHARAHAELAEDVAQVRLDRARAEDELLCDLAVRAPVGDQLGDLALASSERGEWAERAGARVARGAQEAMAEAPQLAGRLAAPSQRAERVERGLRLQERRTGGLTVPRGCQRPPLR